MDNSDIVNDGSRGRGKLANLGEAAGNGFLSGKPQIGTSMHSPLIVSEGQALPQDSFGSFVIGNNTMCDGMKALGRCRLRDRLGSVNHERCICASLAFLGS
jgi:hypothetical protein